MTRIVWIRHGETDSNVARRWQGQSDVPLNETGRRQAMHLASRLAGRIPGAIYSSDLSRAFETATSVGAVVGTPVTPWSLLREIDTGRFTGLSGVELQRRYPAAQRDFSERPWSFAFPDGESYEQLVRRAMEAMSIVLKRHPDGEVWLFSHGGTIRAALYGIFKLPYGQGPLIHVDNTSISTFVWDKHRRGVLMECFNDASHLQEMAIRNFKEEQ